MKKTLTGLFALFLLTILLIALPSCSEKAEPTSLGIPYEALTPVARIPWDLAIHEGYLYVGAGDYGRNISPEVAMRMPLDDTTKWESCGEIPDQQINRFVLLDGTLVIPGTDPTVGWSVGRFYPLGKEGFTVVSTIPNGIHTFDMLLFEDKLFAALGTDESHTPMAVSRDNGESFHPLPLMIGDDAVLVDGRNRVYDLFVLGGKLYALFEKNLFVYTDEPTPRFSFVDSWEKAYSLAEETYVPIIGKANFKDMLFFTTETLYVSRNENGKPTAPQAIQPKGFDVVSDILVVNDSLYLLAYQRTLSDYEISVLVSTDGEKFDELFCFSYPLPAVSFAYDGNDFYFGMGKINAENENNGEILKIAFS